MNSHKKVYFLLHLFLTYFFSILQVLHHKLTVDNHFMVLATDGLWECLDPDAVVRLVFDHTLHMQTFTSNTSLEGIALTKVHKFCFLWLVFFSA